MVSQSSVLQSPAAAPPPGVTANLVDPSNYASAYLTIQVVLFVLAFIFTSIRIYARFFLGREQKLEDYVAIGAWIFCAALFIFQRIYLSLNPVPVGVHMWDTTLQGLEDFLFMQYWCQLLYVPTILCIKVSILLQYITIFSPGKRAGLFWTCHVAIWMNAIFYITAFFLLVFQCHPIAKAWNVLSTGHCLHLQLNNAASAVNIISDFFIFIIPQPTIWGLKMERKQKIKISAVFSVGLLTCATAAARVYAAFKVSRSPDITWWIMLMDLISDFEMVFGIITVCLPTLPKVFKALDSSFSIMGSALTSFLSPQNFKIFSSTSSPQSVPAWSTQYGSDTRLEAEGYKPSVAGKHCDSSSIEMKSYEITSIGDGEKEGLRSLLIRGSKPNKIMRTVEISTTFEKAKKGDVREDRNANTPWEVREPGARVKPTE